MPLSKNALKIEKALNDKGYKLVKYNYKHINDGWTVGMYEIEIERIVKWPMLPIVIRNIEEETLGAVFFEIDKLHNLNDPVTLQKLIDMKGSI